MSKRLLRIALGFIISPTVPALAAYAWEIIAGHEGEGRWACALFLAFGYLAAAIFGIPTYLIFLSRRNVGVAAYLSAGALIGALAVVLFFAPEVWVNWNSNRTHAVALLHNGLPILGGISGAIAAGVFWFIAVRANRDAPV
jgi:hypothetical protein